VIIVPYTGSPRFEKRAQMIEHLREEGKIDTAEFDANNGKGLDKLFLEQLTGQLQFKGFKDGKILTESYRVRLKIRTPTYELFERSRLYPGGRRVSQSPTFESSVSDMFKRSGWSISESMEFGETAWATLYRGIRQELEPPEDEFPLDRIELKTTEPLVDEEESSVYPFVSRVFSYWFELNITEDERLKLDTLFVRVISRTGNMLLMRGDEGVLIEREWVNHRRFHD